MNSGRQTFLSIFRHGMSTKLLAARLTVEILLHIGSPTAVHANLERFNALVGEGFDLTEPALWIDSDGFEGAPAEQLFLTAHKFAGCLATLRAILAAIRLDCMEAEAEVMQQLDRLDLILEAISTSIGELRQFLGMDYRRETLRQGIVRSGVTIGGLHPQEIRITAEPLFDELATNRFILAFLDEALTNAWKHANRPESIEASSDAGDLIIVVRDAGGGFDPGEVQAGEGLSVLELCATSLGGRFEVDTASSTVAIRFPVERGA